MSTFIYRALDEKGNSKEGTVEATSREQVFELLKKYHLLATSINEKKKLSFSLSFFKSLKGVSLKSKVIFSRQLATMIQSGLSITQALKILREQEKIKNKKFAEIIGSLASDIEGGMSFSAALSKFPDVFPSIYVNLVKAGEASGKLDEVLDRISTQLERDFDLTSKIKGAMMYPAFIIVVMIVVVGLILTYVMPQLKSLFEESNAQLPMLTIILLAVSDFVKNFWWLILGGFIGFIFLVRYILRTKRGRSVWDSFKLKIPILGIFILNIYMVRFTRTLATLISSGLPILDSLRIVGDTIGNVHYKKEIEEITKQVESGINLAVPLEKSKRFPTMVSHMLEVGEKTGSVDQILSKLSEFFNNEVNNTVATLSTMLEPVILIIMGIGVGLIVGAILLPIYKLASVM